jgi:uncharacterized protein (TIGR00369 family)
MLDLMSDALDTKVRDTVEQRIVASPYGKLLGLTASEVSEDRVRVRLPFRPEVTTVGEMVHGGAIASLIDTAATAAAWASPRATLEARGTTVGFSLSFLAPGLGGDLFGDARVVKRGGSLCVIEVDVVNEGGDLIARALVTYKLSLPR